MNSVQGLASRALQPIPGLAAGVGVNSTVFVLGLSILLKGFFLYPDAQINTFYSDVKWL